MSSVRVTTRDAPSRLMLFMRVVVQKKLMVLVELALQFKLYRFALDYLHEVIPVVLVKE